MEAIPLQGCVSRRYAVDGFCAHLFCGRGATSRSGACCVRTRVNSRGTSAFPGTNASQRPSSPAIRQVAQRAAERGLWPFGYFGTTGGVEPRRAACADGGAHCSRYLGLLGGGTPVCDRGCKKTWPIG